MKECSDCPQYEKCAYRDMGACVEKDRFQEYLDLRIGKSGKRKLRKELPDNVLAVGKRK